MQRRQSRLTVPNEGLVGQAACSHFGRLDFERFLTELLQRHRDEPQMKSLEYLRREWLGVDAVEALQAAQAASKSGWSAFNEPSQGSRRFWYGVPFFIDGQIAGSISATIPQYRKEDCDIPALVESMKLASQRIGRLLSLGEGWLAE